MRASLAPLGPLVAAGSYSPAARWFASRDVLTSCSLQGKYGLEGRLTAAQGSKHDMEADLTLPAGASYRLSP